MPIEVRHLSNHTHAEYENNKNDFSVKRENMKENNNGNSNNNLTHHRVVKLGESTYKSLGTTQGSL